MGVQEYDKQTFTQEQYNFFFSTGQKRQRPETFEAGCQILRVVAKSGHGGVNCAATSSVWVPLSY